MANAEAILGAMMDISGDDSSGDDNLLGDLLSGLLDDSSGEDISGDDNSLAVLGAALAPKGNAGKMMLARAIAARKLAGSQVLSARKPSSAGVQAIGFFQAGITSGSPAVITTQPQTWFKPMRLVVPESIAPFFTVDNIIVGNKSQFPSPVSLPAEMFIPAAEAVVMDLDTVNPALNLTVAVTNISGVTQNFRAGFVGKEVTP
jgi:hypothetical protein